MEPGLTADWESVTITDRNYQVTFYMYFGKQGGLAFNGIRVKGWPDNSNVHKVLEEWNIPKIDQEYVKKINWLMENPGYKTPLVKKTPQKRIYASQVE